MFASVSEAITQNLDALGTKIDMRFTSNGNYFGTDKGILNSYRAETLGSKSCKTPLKFLRKKVFKLHIFFWGGYRLETFSLVT